MNHTGWRWLIGSPKLQIIFHKRATKYRSFLPKMTYKDKGSYESSPPCTKYCKPPLPPQKLPTRTCATTSTTQAKAPHICATWLNHIYNVTNSYIKRDSHHRYYKPAHPATWMCATTSTTRSKALHAAAKDTLNRHATWHIHMCHTTNSYIDRRHDAFMCVTRLVRTFSVTPPRYYNQWSLQKHYTWTYATTLPTWSSAGHLTPLRKAPYIDKRHDAFICVTRLIHTYNVTSPRYYNQQSLQKHPTWTYATTSTTRRSARRLMLLQKRRVLLPWLPAEYTLGWVMWWRLLLFARLRRLGMLCM